MARPKNLFQDSDQPFIKASLSACFVLNWFSDLDHCPYNSATAVQFATYTSSSRRLRIPFLITLGQVPSFQVEESPSVSHDTTIRNTHTFPHKDRLSRWRFDHQFWARFLVISSWISSQYSVFVGSRSSFENVASGKRSRRSLRVYLI